MQFGEVVHFWMEFREIIQQQLIKQKIYIKNPSIKRNLIHVNNFTQFLLIRVNHKLI